MALTERYSNVGGSGAADGTSQANAWDIADVLKATSVAAGGQRVNHQGDWSPTGANITFDLVATDNLPFLLQGYDTVPQDLEGLPNSGLEPVITLDNTGNRYFNLSSNRYTTFRNLHITGTTDGSLIRNTHGQKFEYCRLENLQATGSPRLVTLEATTCSFDTCYLAMTSTTSGTYYFNFGSDYFGVFTNCVFDGGYMVFNATRNISLVNCLFLNQYMRCISYGTGNNYQILIVNCTFVGARDQVAIGADNVANQKAKIISRCIFASFDARGLWFTDATDNKSNTVSNNAIWNNIGDVGGGIKNATIPPTNTVTLTEDPFVDSAGGNYSLKPSVVGAYGYSQGFHSLPNTPNRRDIGAVQHAASNISLIGGKGLVG
tara:strand:- start:18058 stop:19185 length:1128 start_codon:yes stop_codon:yes gene_type:complete